MSNYHLLRVEQCRDGRNLVSVVLTLVRRVSGREVWWRRVFMIHPSMCFCIFHVALTRRRFFSYVDHICMVFPEPLGQKTGYIQEKRWRRTCRFLVVPP